MFLAEFFTILVIIAAIILGYKYRHEILKWLNKKPSVAKNGILKDLETLQHYKVEDAISRIVEDKRQWAESKAKLEKELRGFEQSVTEKENKPEMSK